MIIAKWILSDATIALSDLIPDKWSSNLVLMGTLEKRRPEIEVSKAKLHI
jgi:hypothetical protein